MVSVVENAWYQQSSFVIVTIWNRGMGEYPESEPITSASETGVATAQWLSRPTTIQWLDFVAIWNWDTILILRLTQFIVDTGNKVRESKAAAVILIISPTR